MERLVQNEFTESWPSYQLVLNPTQTCIAFIEPGIPCGRRVTHVAPNRQLQYCDDHVGTCRRVYGRYKLHSHRQKFYEAKCLTRQNALMGMNIPNVRFGEGIFSPDLKNYMVHLTAEMDFRVAYDYTCVCTGSDDGHDHWLQSVMDTLHELSNRTYVFLDGLTLQELREWKSAHPDTYFYLSKEETFASWQKQYREEIRKQEKLEDRVTKRKKDILDEMEAEASQHNKFLQENDIPQGIPDADDFSDNDFRSAHEYETTDSEAEAAIRERAMKRVRTKFAQMSHDDTDTLNDFLDQAKPSSSDPMTDAITWITEDW